MTEPIPDDAVQRRQTWLIAGVLSLVVVLIGVGVAFAVLATRAPVSKAPVYTPAEETSAGASSTVPTSSADQSSSVPATTTPSSDSTSTTTTPPGQVVRSGKIAYRRNGQIWVAGEDGAGAKSVVASGTVVGKFALSPDGRTLVMLQGSNPALDHAVLVDVASGTQTQLSLSIDLPTWSADSSWLVYTAGNATSGYSIRRVDRNGSHDSLVVTGGAQPQISADGKKVAYAKNPQPSANDVLQVIGLVSGDKPVVVPNSQGATRFSWASGGSFYFARPTISTTSGWLRIAERTLASSSIVASLPAGNNVSPGPLFVGPDGSKVYFAMTGDDGYSRLYVADTAAKKIAYLTTRRDAYSVGWLLNGSGVLYIDGNSSIPGESPSLYRMNTDGSHKKVVVSGASL